MHTCDAITEVILILRLLAFLELFEGTAPDFELNHKLVNLFFQIDLIEVEQIMKSKDGT